LNPAKKDQPSPVHHLKKAAWVMTQVDNSFDARRAQTFKTNTFKINIPNANPMNNFFIPDLLSDCGYWAHGP
jgi:hypothetical protein